MGESWLGSRPLAGLGMLAGLLGYIASCKQDHPSLETRTFHSPDGAFRLDASIHMDAENTTRHGCVKFEVLDSGGKVILRQQTHVPFSDKWDFTWDEANRIWLYSESIGVFFWSVHPDGRWLPDRFHPGSSPPCPFPTCEGPSDAKQ